MATPRLCGRLPSQRLRPALPMAMLSCWLLPSEPTVARQSQWTSRTSPEGRRTCAQSPSLAMSCAAEPAAAAELAAAADLQLDVVDGRAGRDEAQRQRVARLDVGGARRDDLVADLEVLRGEDVALLAVHVVEQRDEAPSGSGRTGCAATLAGTPSLSRLKSITR